MVNAHHASCEVSRRHGVNLRTAAYIMAIDKIAALDLRRAGNLPVGRGPT